MKISQKQANLLAKEVHQRLVKQSRSSVPEATIGKVRAYKEKRRELDAIVRAAQDELNKHDATLKSIVGIHAANKIYTSDTIEQIIEKLKERAIPRVDEIEDKIVLKAMFANEDDMESFVNGVMKDFTKKRTATAN